jgi:predicted ester cyclase
MSSTKFEEKIKNRLRQAWDEWKPGYQDWLTWSNSLYAPDATIVAIGDKPQGFKVYQESMKVYRDAFSMEMGPIENCIAEGNVVAITYNMYMTQKGEIMGIPATGKRITIPTTEFNTFEEIPGYDEPMVVKLELIAGGLLEHLVTFGADGKIIIPN